MVHDKRKLFDMDLFAVSFAGNIVHSRPPKMTNVRSSAQEHVEVYNVSTVLQ